jgi:phospholipid N-methyltransferase
MAGNESNKMFYSNVPLHVFKDMAKQGGFSEHKDLKLIATQIPSNATVLELGAGYGRCIDFLIERKHTGKIIAIEHSDSLISELEEKYKGITNVNIVQDDLNTTKQNFEAEIVLWIFSGLLDFSKEEQVAVLKKIRSWISVGGKLFVDIPQLSPLTIARFTTKQDVVMDTPYGSIETFLPSSENMADYAKQAGFAGVTAVDYDTDTDKKRTMYTFYTSPF